MLCGFSKDGNNGGYANDWLIGDTKKNEIASLELGLRNVTLERKRTAILPAPIFRLVEAGRGRNGF